MNKKLNKKAVADRVFVYAFSVIVIVFLGWLVVKFIAGFTTNVNDKTDIDLYNQLKLDYQTVYSTYGTEKVMKYRTTSKIEYVCFIPSKSCINNINLEDVQNFNGDTLTTMFEAGDNVITFNENDFEGSTNIGKFKSEDGCFCIKPKVNKFQLFYENRKNEVYISENN